MPHTDILPQEQLAQLIQKARSSGADAADALLVEGRSVSVAWRGGKLESLEHAEGGDLGLRVLIGHKQASVASSDRSHAALEAMVERAVAMAKAASEDPFCGLASPEEIGGVRAEIEMADDGQMETETLIALARESEEAALSVKGVAQCESTDAGSSETNVYMAASNGFAGHYRRTSYSISAVVLAGEGTAMERDYDFSSVVFKSDLDSATQIGQNAAQKAVMSLGARKMPSCKVPVVFSPRVAHELVDHFADAILGSAVARGTSFLKDSLDKIIFPETITIMDDPHRARGLRSKPFDGEGLSTTPRKIVDQGRLTSWLMDLRSARQLDMKSTGHASRGTTGVPHPSPTNFYMAAGELSPDALIKDIKSGFYVTEMMGMGINDVTGDFSQAARGFWIENGQIAFPVSEMTVASNLKAMFLNLTAANDLTFRYGIDAPTLRVEGMTIAGV
ncbi:MAG TPA: modulator protein [Rhodospirillaceae bacterium]|nr:modulator protein [Rhodospirillaceae bacterium]